jgi:hypothetical protein
VAGRAEAEVTGTTRAKAKKGPAAPKAAEPPARARHPIIRTIPAGSRIDPDAIVTVHVANPKIGIKNHARWEGESATVKDILAVPGGPTVGDLRYDYERAFIDIVPVPAKPDKPATK